MAEAPAQHIRWKQLPDTLRGAVLKAIDDGQSAREIHEACRLAEMGFSVDQLRRVMTRRRKRVRPDTSIAIRGPSAEDYDLLWSIVREKAAAGTIKGYEIVGFIKAMHDRERLDLEQRAEQRAKDRFEVEIKKLRGQVESLSHDLEGAKVTPEEAAQRMRDILGIRPRDSHA